jgi:hypothetical protein
MAISFSSSMPSGAENMMAINMIRTVAVIMIIMGIILLIWAIIQNDIWRGKDTEETLQLKQVERNITTKIDAMSFDITKAIKELTKEVHDGFANQQKTQRRTKTTDEDNEKTRNKQDWFSRHTRQGFAAYILSRKR